MKTRITGLLGCRYPILQGAMAGIGTWRFAAAVANAGAHGIITASVSRTPERLREDIRQCRAATSGSFGVNLTFGMPHLEEMLDVCIDERVAIETAAYKPDAVADRIKTSGLPWVHKAARVKDAMHAEKCGADALIIVGLEGTGFKSPDQLTTLTTMLWAARQIKAPLIAAGGIADARGFAAALALGAEGVMMGTAFMLTQESPLKDELKKRLAGTPPDDPSLRRRVLGSADPNAAAELNKMRGTVPIEQWLGMVERVNLKDREWREAMPATGGVVDGADPTRLVSMAIAGVDGIPTVKELVDRIMHGADEIIARLKS
jgi:NAD(P)H-dependent flavin oxidoreductase YrpB (nitropropane dioxygenase family)